MSTEETTSATPPAAAAAPADPGAAPAASGGASDEWQRPAYSFKHDKFSSILGDHEEPAPPKEYSPESQRAYERARAQYEAVRSFKNDFRQTLEKGVVKIGDTEYHLSDADQDAVSEFMRDIAGGKRQLTARDYLTAALAERLVAQDRVRQSLAMRKQSRTTAGGQPQKPVSEPPKVTANPQKEEEVQGNPFLDALAEIKGSTPADLGRVKVQF